MASESASGVRCQLPHPLRAWTTSMMALAMAAVMVCQASADSGSKMRYPGLVV